jgi:hypothetical protein
MPDIAGVNKLMSRLDQYMANVSMKLNLKLGHTNHSVDFAADIKGLLYAEPAEAPQTTGIGEDEVAAQLSSEPLIDTIILGSDVTHPLKGSASPSIASIVGSVDKHLARYLGSVRYQASGKEVGYLANAITRYY